MRVLLRRGLIWKFGENLLKKDSRRTGFQFAQYSHKIPINFS
jgi:hypothetical protein